MKLITISPASAGAILAMLSCAVASAGVDSDNDSIRHIAPCLDDQTCFVAAITLPGTVGDDYLSKLGDWLGQVHPDARGAQ